MGKYTWVICMTFALLQLTLFVNAEDGYNYSPPRIQLTYPTTKVEVRDETIVCKEFVTQRPTKAPVPERIVERIEFIPEEHLKRDRMMREKIEDQIVRLNDQGRELDNQREQITTQKEVITERIEEIRLKDRTIGDLNNRIDDQIQRIENQERENKELKDTVRNRDREIERRDITIEDQRVRIDDQTPRIENLEQENKDQKDTIRNRDREIERRDVTIEEQRTRIEEQATNLDDRDRQIREQRATILERLKDIEDRDNSITTHLETIDMLVEELRRLRGAPNLGVVLGDKIIEFIEMEKQRVKTTDVEGGVEITQRRTKQRVTTSSGSDGDGTDTTGSRGSGFRESSRSSFSSSSSGGGGGGGIDTTGSREGGFRESSRSSFSSSSGGGSGGGGGGSDTTGSREGGFRESSRNSFSSSSTSSSGSRDGSQDLNTENEDELNFNSVGGGIEFPSGSSRFTSRIPLIPLGGYTSNRKSENKISSATVSRPSIVYGPPNLEASASTRSFKSVSRSKDSRKGGLRSSRNSRVNRHAAIPQALPSRALPTFSTNNRRTQESPTKLVRTTGYRSYLIVPSG